MSTPSLFPVAKSPDGHVKQARERLLDMPNPLKSTYSHFYTQLSAGEMQPPELRVSSNSKTAASQSESLSRAHRQAPDFMVP